MSTTKDHDRQRPWTVLNHHVMSSGLVAFLALGGFIVLLFFWTPGPDLEQLIMLLLPAVVLFFHLFSSLTKAQKTTDKFRRLPDGARPLLVATLTVIGLLIGSYLAAEIGGPASERTGFGNETLLGPQVYLPIFGSIIGSYLAVKIGQLWPFKESK